MVYYPSISGICTSMKQASNWWGGCSIVNAAFPLSAHVTTAPYFFSAPAATLRFTTLSSTTSICFPPSRLGRVDGCPLSWCLLRPIPRACCRQAVVKLNRRGFIIIFSTYPADLNSSSSVELMVEVAKRNIFGRVCRGFDRPFCLSSLRRRGKVRPVPFLQASLSTSTMSRWLVALCIWY